MEPLTNLCFSDSNLTLENNCITALRNDFYAKVAAIIRDNPDKTYEMLMAEFGLTPWTIKMAVRLNDIKRTRGRKAAV